MAEEDKNKDGQSSSGDSSGSQSGSGSSGSGGSSGGSDSSGGSSGSGSSGGSSGSGGSSSSGDKDKDKDKDKGTTQQNVLGPKIKAAAEKYIGKPYDMGASGPDKYDCSGFVQAVLKDVGIDISRTADLQYLDVRDRMGKIYDAEDNVPICGDLIFYENTYSTSTAENCGITHVGIMLGDGEVIEANCSTGVAKHKPLVLGSYKHHFGRLDATGIKLGQEAKAIASTTKARRSDSGTKIEEMGEYVTITKLPENKNYAEPIYPDYVTVSDTVPAWVLSEVQSAEQVADKKSQGKDGDASETAPNGRHYFEADIKAIMDKDSSITREKAIEQLSKQEEYTKEWTDPDKAQKPADPKSDEATEIAPNGKHYSENDIQYLIAQGQTRAQAVEILMNDEKYKKKEESSSEGDKKKEEEAKK